MNRNYTLDVLKLVFAYIVAFFHVGTTISPGPTVAVQIFFILSGFFLAQKFYRSDPDYTAWNYTLDHVKGLYPHYLFSHLVFFLYLLARAVLYFLRSPSADGAWEILRSCYNQIPDLLFLQSSYTFHDSINYPLWQISALLIAGYFVFALLRYNEKLSRQILFPGAVLMLLSLLQSGVDLWANFGPIYLPLLRAFGPMCIGVLTFYFSTTRYWADLQRHGTLLNLCALLGLAGIFVFGDHANIFQISMPVVILSCWMEDSWLNFLQNRRCFRYCGKFSYAVYLNHALIERITCARLFPNIRPLGPRELLVYFLLLTVYSMLTQFLVEKGMAWLRSRKITDSAATHPNSDTPQR